MIVELRFLHVLVSPVSGDRVTVGLMHWDGTTIRTACAFHALPPWFALGREDLESTVRALLRRAAKRSEKDPRARSMLGLSDAAPVAEGFGASLFWSPVVRAQTGDPEAHFGSVAAEVHLVEDATVGAASYARAMRKDLIELGKSLARQEPERIRVSQPVGTLLQITPPVSWLNGRWHHALPIHLHRDRMERPAFTVVGQVVCAIPDDERAVVVVDVPEQGTREREAMREVNALRDALAGKQTDVLAVHGRTEMARVIRAKIERDIGISPVARKAASSRVQR